MIRSAIIIISTMLLIDCFGKINLNTGESDYRIAMGDELVDKYEDHPSIPKRIIASGDSVSIHLKQVFIANYSERWEKAMASVLTTTVRGEIALAREPGSGEALKAEPADVVLTRIDSVFTEPVTGPNDPDAVPIVQSSVR